MLHQILSLLPLFFFLLGKMKDVILRIKYKVRRYLMIVEKARKKRKKKKGRLKIPFVR